MRASSYFQSALVAFLVSSASAAEPNPPPAGPDLFEVFQRDSDTAKVQLRRPLDELRKQYQEGLTALEKEYAKFGNQAGVLAAIDALKELSVDAVDSPSNDKAIEDLRTKYLRERTDILHQLAPQVRAMLEEYIEKLTALAAVMGKQGSADDGQMAGRYAEQLRNWLAHLPPRRGLNDDELTCLLQKGPPTLTSVVAWGRNDQHQATVPPRLFGVVAVAGGLYHSLALRSDGSVVAWGGNEDGQTNIPEGLSHVTAIAAGEKHSLALRSDGTVAAWGYNKEHQCDVPLTLSHVKAIASHCWHSLALKQDGTVVAWGRDAHGQLNVPPGLTEVVAIKAGGSHNLALKSDGTVVAWGLNDHGQTDVPAGLSHVVAIAAGHYHSLALKDDGTIVGWGFNNYGQVRIPPGATRVTAIAAQGWHSVAVAKDGSVFAWGFAHDGQTNVPNDLSHVEAIASGTYHVLTIVPMPP